MNDNQKKRIHELDYAIKVISHTKVDKETIQLSESLFNAKITAKQSSCIIKDIQRTIQQKIKFYDEQLKNGDSFKKQKDKNSLSPDINKRIENQVQSLQPNPINNNKEQIQTPIKNFNEIQQSQKSLKQQTQSISPTKRQTQYSERTNYSSPKIKPKQIERQSCYSRQKVKQSQKELENTQSINKVQSARVIAIADRNEEWKQKLKNKIDNEQKKQQIKQMIDCTFKPRINNQKNTNKYQKSMSKEFQIEINELMHLIDNQSQIKSKL